MRNQLKKVNRVVNFAIALMSFLIAVIVIFGNTGHETALYMANSVFIVPVMIVAIGFYNAKQEGFTLKSLLFVLKKLIIKFFFEMSSFVLVICMFGIFDLIGLMFLILVTLGVLVVGIYSVVLLSSIVLLSYKFYIEIRKAKELNEPIFNLETIRLLPVIWLALIMEYFLVSSFFVIILEIGSQDVLVSITTLGLTLGLVFVLVLQAILSGLFNVSIKAVYSKSLIFMICVALIVYGPLSLLLIPVLIIHSFTGMLVGLVFGFLTKMIKKIKNGE